MTRWLVTQEEMDSATPGSLEARFISFVMTHHLPMEPADPQIFWETQAPSKPKASWWQPALAWLLPRAQEGEVR
mgnify:FL=1